MHRYGFDRAGPLLPLFSLTLYKDKSQLVAGSDSPFTTDLARRSFSAVGLLTKCSTPVNILILAYLTIAS